jgi:hypothetical protein
VYEHPDVVGQLVSNYIRYTTSKTIIILHASLSTPYDFQEEKWSRILSHPRVYLNHVRFQTGVCQPGVFAAHLSNALRAAEIVSNISLGRHDQWTFVPTASNSMLFRPGVEQHIQAMRGRSMLFDKENFGIGTSPLPNRNVQQQTLRLITGGADHSSFFWRDFNGCFFPLNWWTDIALFDSRDPWLLSKDRAAQAVERSECDSSEDYVMAEVIMHNGATGIIKSNVSHPPAISNEDAAAGHGNRCLDYRINFDIGVTMSQVHDIQAFPMGFYSIKRVSRDPRNKARVFLSGV